MSVGSIPKFVEASMNNNDSKRKTSFVARFVANNLNDVRSGEFWRAGLAEFVGTFLLTFFGVAISMRHEDAEPVPLLQIAIGVGFIVGALITALTTVSGGHINPAISMGFLVSNQITFIRLVVYAIFQTLGAISAVAFLTAILPSTYHGTHGLITPARDVTDVQAVAMEMVITGTLIFVTIAMVDRYRQDVAGSVPLMVGLTVAANILIAGNVSAAAMNPARAMGSAVIAKSMDKVWVYWVGPMSGAAVAGLLYDNVFSTRPMGIIAKCIRIDTHTSKRKEVEMPLNDVDFHVTN